ncbi:MAG: hypothetical protein JRJ49_09480 [Deltaproteobacteria bacterium]|nr:hypothetical protein [Deltaproteobacteria bacterium]
MKQFKNRIYEILKDEGFAGNMEVIHSLPAKKTVNALISLLYHPNQTVKQNGIYAIGAVVSKIAEKNMEYARVIMRRLMWSLNDESGGIGWGAPLAMAEIMAQNNKLAEEYCKILISYALEDRNPIDFKELKQEVILGLKRLNLVRPDLLSDVAHLL